ncbi:hypothetical protein NE237_005593 [Protea cynaroides]|uniref:Uncharacterized protein n=1 Tax=Protea cynaroides TaxID=273540 RepID=A0A9Q0GL82_9MAGN|nr:hypothetical protein NE237_005593 [Protea cynaroides]
MVMYLGVFAAGNILMGSDLQPQELEFEGDDCEVYGSDPMRQVYNSGDIQFFFLGPFKRSFIMIAPNWSMVVGLLLLTSEISTLEETTFKVGKLSAEEGKEKIHRYMKKRNERNFSKKIKVYEEINKFYDEEERSYIGSLSFLS